MGVTFLSPTTKRILFWEFLVLSALILYKVVVGNVFVHR